MEFLIRVAIEKYKNKGAAATEDEALQMLLDHMLPKCDEYDLTKWLWDRFFNENVEIVLRSYMVLFR